MFGMCKDFIEHLKKEYAEGTKIKLIRMSGEESLMPAGTTGIVMGVDDIGQIHVCWDNGRCLALNTDCDLFTVVEKKEG